MTPAENRSTPVPAGLAEPASQAAPQAADPAALTVEQLARALALPADAVRQHVERGAPSGPDGRINLVRYAAWLNKELAAPESAEGLNADAD